MAWIGPDKQYTFTIARLLEGLLEIDSLTVNGVDVITGGILTGTTPAIHPGDSVSVDMTAINTGETSDDFQITIDVVGASTGTSVLSETSITFTLGVYDPTIGTPTNAYSPTDFTMPDENVNVTVETYHYE